MKNPYILPICFAAAAHGALLFGFTKNPTPVKRAEEKTITCIFPIRPPEEEPVVTVEPDAAASKTATAPEAPQPPRSPEPLVIETNSFATMTPPPIQPIGSAELRQILEPSIGIGDGRGKVPWIRDGILSSDLLDNPPRTRFQASPSYPFQARRDGMAGEVMVDFMVDEAGRVMDPRIVRSSHPIFDEPTLRAVTKWRFEPGRRDGKIVKFRMTVPVVFRLDEGM